MPDINTPEFEAAFIADAKRRAATPIKVELQVGLAITLIGQVQLALRHPANTGPSAQEADAFVRSLIDAIADTATLRAGLEAGFDARYDVPRRQL